MGICRGRRPRRPIFSVCEKSNIIGQQPTSLRSTSFARSATSFICAARGGNDVLALLEMMLTFGQMMLCLAAQMKKSNSYELDFLAAALGFEPR